jgi:hypothetical protein
MLLFLLLEYLTFLANSLFWTYVRCSDWSFPVSPTAPTASPTINIGGPAPTAAMAQLARMVAEGGDDIEEMARERNRDDPTMWLVTCLLPEPSKQAKELPSYIRF